ncbi:hypothetical protein GX563_10615 [Candidatus Bathyarchaeota archaeon]|nr:hypothetical protein [Candidatus Bathyarchaeota archaeon]
MLQELQLSLGIISVLLVVILVYLFFRVYKTQRQIILLGLPLGFLLLAISYFFLGIHLFYPFSGTLSYALMWLRVVTQTGGFLLIAISYLLAGRIKRETKLTIPTISLALVLSVTLAFGLLDISNNPGLSIIYQLNELFVVANLALLSYIIIFLIRNIQLSRNNSTGLISAPVAFTAFWIGQLSYLIWEFIRSDIALVGSQVARVSSLAIFIYIYYLASKEALSDDSGQT